MESSYLGHGDAVFSVAFSADDKLVFTAGRDRKIHVWEASDAKKAGEIAGFDNEIYKLIVTGSDVFSCSADKLVRQHRATGNHELVRTFAGHADFVYTLAYYQAEQRLAAGSFDGNVRVWSAPDGQLITSFRAAPGLVSGTP